MYVAKALPQGYFGGGEANMRFNSMIPAACILAIATCVTWRAGADEEPPVARWTLDRKHVRGARVRPSEGKLTGRIYGKAAVSSQKPQALELSGDKSRVLLGKGVDRKVLPGKSLSVEAWVRVREVREWSGIISVIQDNGPFEKGWCLGANGGRFFFCLSSAGSDDGDGKLTYLKAPADYLTGYWYHVVGTYNGKVQKLYVDGKMVASGLEQSGAINYPAEGFFVLGAYQDKDEFYSLAGSLQEVSMWSRALDGGEVRKRFEETRELFPGSTDLSEATPGWPTYLHDNERSGITPETLRLPLTESWRFKTRGGPRPAWPPPAKRDIWNNKANLKARVTYDRAFHVVAGGGNVYFGSSADDKVYCIDAASGRERWSFFTEGPVRLAPTWSEGRLYFGSDDGNVYCLDARSGELQWKRRLSPRQRRVPGNGRIISVWPVRSSVMVDEGRVFCCGGLFPRQGVFYCALDARTGKLISRREVSVSPQGYLTRQGEKISISQGRSPDAFVASLKRKGKGTKEGLGSISQDFSLSIIGAGAVRFAGGQGRVAAFSATDGSKLWEAPVEGAAYSLAVAVGGLFVSTDTGTVHCFRPAGTSSAAREEVAAAEPAEGKGVPSKVPSAGTILDIAGLEKGYCFVLDCVSGELALELVRRTKLQVVAVCPDDSSAVRVRKTLDSAGVYGRAVVHVGKLGELGYADYLANLVVFEGVLYGRSPTKELAAVKRLLKPGSGIAILGADYNLGRSIQGVVNRFYSSAGRRWNRLGRSTGAWGMLRTPALKGAGEWTHMYGDSGNTICSGDELVKGPFDLQWFGRPGPRNLVDRHHRTVAPLVKDGRMFLSGDDRIIATDSYNGTPLWDEVITGTRRIGAVRDSGNMVVSEEALYIAAGAECLALGLDTGKRLRSYPVPPAPDGKVRHWAYICSAAGKLIGSSARPGSLRTEVGREAIVDVYDDAKSIVCSGALFCLEADSGKRSWDYRPRRGAIINTTLAVSSGRAWFIESANPATLEGPVDRYTLDKLLSGGAELVCLGIDDGKVRWRRGLAELKARHCLFLSSAKGTVVLSGSRNEGNTVRYDLAAFNAADGKRLWSRSQNTGDKTGGTHGEQDHRHAVIGNVLYAEPFAYELRSGKPLSGWKWNKGKRGGCGNVSASLSNLFFRDGSASFFDLSRGVHDKVTNISRPGCWINMIPAGGLLLIPEGSSGCTCNYAVQGSMAFVPSR